MRSRSTAFAVVDVFMRVNGYSITVHSNDIYEHMIRLFEAHSFDMEHLVPWLQKIAHSL